MTINLSKITNVRFIKLGEKGCREASCIADNNCYIGFCSADPDCFRLISEAPIASDLSEAWRKVWDFHYNSAKGSDPARRKEATRTTNQLRFFFESGDETLWVTFHARKLYYAVLDPAIAPRRSSEDGGSYRQVVDKWYCSDVSGRELLEDKLSGRVTMTKGFPGTSCAVGIDVRNYLLRRINCQRHPYQIKIDNAMEELYGGLSEAIRSLTPGDFELLVELIFSQTLRRVSITGRVMSFIDIAFENPLNGAMVAVQVKARTTPVEFEQYLQAADRGTYSAFYYVFHTSEIALEEYIIPPEIDASIVTILDTTRIAPMAIEAGLVSWIIDKAG
ncbi:restriction endonuclease [Cyanobium sp. Morenito 9A2]|uniref:restriction endonuclease n=1 Tax=Cyanobium sp. Morenito 9A2 TaxID=2823718 RepID=UPI0020CE04F3|nr:restriction endonuclease [Cyanobium sp. Morenito 9A2]MCP9850768.1 hypothetical protein [Cyanobium sp. Morenito 9A2]